MRNGTCAAIALLVLAACDGGVKPAPAANPPVPATADAPRVPEASVPATAPVSVETPKTEPERTLAWARSNPAFRDVKFTTADAAPFVVLQEIRQADVRDTKRTYDATRGVTTEEPVDGTVNPAKVAQNRTWTEKGNALARREALLLAELHRRFREEFADALKLPVREPKDGAIAIFVAWNRESFDRVLAEASPKELGPPVPPRVGTVYIPELRQSFTYVGDESLQSTDVLPCAGGFAQKSSDQTLLRAGAERLLAGYSSLLRGSTFDAADPSADSGPMWFRTGFAELLCGVEVEEDKLATLAGVTWRHERIRPDSVAVARRDRGSAERWTIEQLLRPTSSAEVDSRGQRVDPGSTGMASLFAVRSWGLCHFLRHYDGGKYRPQFVQWLRMVMTGKPTSFDLARIMGLPDASDWGPVEREFEWYWSRLIERKVGRSKTTGEWNRPETGVPEGRVEDDPDFCEVWEEREAARAARKPK